MAEPRSFRIALDMKAALQRIQVESGYHYDIGQLAVKLNKSHQVEERTHDTDNPLGPHRPFVILEFQPSTFDYTERSKKVMETIPFTVTAIHDSDSTDDDDMLRTFFRLCADVEQALVTPPPGESADKGIQRGGLAFDTRILEHELAEHEGRTVHAVISGEVGVHRTYGAPNG